MSATFTETSHTGTGSGSTVRTTKALIRVSGTFVGTITVKWTDAGGTTHTVQESAADLTFTAPGERVLDFGVPVDLYLECTAYSSGTIVASITGARVSYY